MLVQCCVCGRVRKNAQWIRLAKTERSPHEAISHGYCPKCAEQAFEEIRRAHPPVEYTTTPALSA